MRNTHLTPHTKRNKELNNANPNPCYLYAWWHVQRHIFFKLSDLPERCQTAGVARDQFLLRVVGSPDPYGKQIDGLGNGSSSTSKVVIISPCTDGTHDVNYLFGQVAIDKPMIDWSGNCGNLTGAVGAFAIINGLVGADKIPDNGICTVKIYQQNIGKTIIAHVPIKDGQVQASVGWVLAPT